MHWLIEMIACITGTYLAERLQAGEMEREAQHRVWSVGREKEKNKRPWGEGGT